MSAGSASSTRRQEGVAVGDDRPVDKVRALQWTLYRCAKQEPERRFHALYGHVYRRDVLWRAWAGVCANRGREWVLEADIRDCFASIGHDALIAQVGRRVVDRSMLKLIRAWLRVGVLEDGVTGPGGAGGLR